MSNDNIIKLKGRLAQIANEGWRDIEQAHKDADAALLDCIDDEEVRELFKNIKKWYI